MIGGMKEYGHFATVTILLNLYNSEESILSLIAQRRKLKLRECHGFAQILVSLRPSLTGT